MTTGRRTSLLNLLGLLSVPTLICAVVVSCASPPAMESMASLPYDGRTYGILESISPNKQVVVCWHPHSPGWDDILPNLVDEFNRTNEWGITVQTESQGAYDDLYQKIVANIPAKKLPSVAVAYQDQAATYAAQGVLVALGPYVESGKWGYTQEQLNDFFPVALEADRLPQFDARYGWPAQRSIQVMYYNEDWLNELGYEGPPETWRQFADMSCSAVEQPFSGATGDGPILGYEYSVDASSFATFVFSAGGDMINEDGTRFVFNSPEGLRALTFLKELQTRRCAAPTNEPRGDQTDFAAGRALFTVSSTSSLPSYRRAVDTGAGFNWSVNPPPHTTAEPRLNIHGPSHSIFVTTPEEQLAAWLFIKWMSKPEQQASWASGTAHFPTHQAAAGLLADYLAEHPTYEKALGFMSQDCAVEPPVAGYDHCRAAITQTFSAILAGEDAQIQLDAAVEQCNRYLRSAAPPADRGQ